MKKYIRPGFMSILILIVCSACDEKQVTTEVESQLIKPYFQLLTQKKYKEAYTIFTSDFYKNHSTLGVYSDSYEKNKAKRGELKHYSIHNITLSYSLFGKDEIRGEISFHFQNEKYAKPILFLISQNDKGKYLIDAAWHHNKFSSPDGLDGPF